MMETSDPSTTDAVAELDAPDVQKMDEDQLTQENIVNEENNLNEENKLNEDINTTEENNEEVVNNEIKEPVESKSSKAGFANALSVTSFRSQQHVADLGRDCTALHHVFGADISRKGNMSLIEDDTIIYATATAVVFQNVSTSAKEYLLSISDAGIGCVAVHPSRKYFAVGGKGFQPNIYIFSYPSKKLMKVLSGGAERGYSCMNFSPDGDKLASVSTSPDFMLTIWDWQEQQMGLHSKAFGQDIYNVFFSKDDPGRLTTSGVGHIRFWKMASTFTGLKLQGSIGKFGKIDLSDIDTFVELPDGKVISSTETGALLVWEGHFIKCRLTRSDGIPCHVGPVTFLTLDRTEKYIISAAQDGYIRWWSFSTIDNAEVDSDHSMDFELEPVAEFYLGTNIGIKSMIDSGGCGNKRLLVILDTTGRLLSFTFAVHEKNQETNPILILCESIKNLSEANANKLRNNVDNEDFVVDEQEKFYIDKHVFENFHAQIITGMDTCPFDQLVVTCSTDGTVRCVDYVKRQLLAMRSFSSGATCLRWLPRSLDPTGKTVAVGFADGVVRLLTLGETMEEQEGTRKTSQLSFLRKMVFKPHNAAVLDLNFSADGSLLATSGADGIVFFFQCSQLQELTTAWNPVRFVTVLPNTTGVANKSPVSCRQLSWAADGLTLLCTCSDGVLREIDLQTLREQVAERAVGEEVVSFEADFPVNELVTKVPLPSTAGKGSVVSTAPTPGKPAGSGESVETNPSSPVKGETAPALHNTASVSSLPTADNTTRPGTADTAATNNTASTVVSQAPAKINAAIYSINRDLGGVVTSASLNQKNYTFESDLSQELPIRELGNGLYTTEGKDQLKMPSTSSFRYSHSKAFLVTGLADGSVVLRPSEYLEVFVRATAHNSIQSGAAIAMTSFDDRYLLSAGSDGILVVRRLRLDLIESRAQTLFQDLEAGVFGNTWIKPEPSTSAAGVGEPNYLTFVSTLIESSEKNLFEKHSKIASSAVPQVAVLEQLHMERDEKDIAPGTYSIQDNRLKLEEDARKVSATELKHRIKSSIIALRKDYENIMRENESIPEVARLSEAEMLVDEEYFDLLKIEGNKMIDEVHKECEHDLEKSTILLKKLKERMMNGLLMEEITLSAFYPPKPSRISKSTVCSFRARSLDPSVTEILEEVHRIVKATEMREAQIRTNETAQRKANEAMSKLMNRLHHTGTGKDQDDSQSTNNNSTTATTTAAAATGGGGAGDDSHSIGTGLAQLEIKDATTATAAALSHTELLGSASENTSVAARRQHRIERKEELKKHLIQKPNENEDDIRDLNAIQIAEKTIGDYKLKCADDYEVPTEQRNNAMKKIRQMALLEESMLNIRLQFNQRFLTLRKLKYNIINNINYNNNRIKEINEKLHETENSEFLWQPEHNPDEFPDDSDEITENELIKYEKERNQLPWERVIPPKHMIITGNKIEIIKNSNNNKYNTILNNDTTTITTTSSISNNNKIEKKELPKDYEVNSSIFTTYINTTNNKNILETDRLYQLEQKIPILKRIHNAMNKRIEIVDKTTSQNKIINQYYTELKHEKSMILSNIQKNIDEFNAAINELRLDRHILTADIKLSELKLLILYQEYQLLLTFETKDMTLQQKQIKCKTEETEIKSLANENKSKLESKEEELQHWSEKLTLIGVEFKGMLPDSHPYCETLTKIFRKRIKRSKGREEGDEEEDFDSDGDDEDEDDEEEEEVEDICPPGCDQGLFERILDLREKKLDTEEVSADIQRGIEDLRKTIDRLKSREKQIVKDAQQTELEVQQFQLQKQAALNQISVVIPLRMSQIHMFNTSGCMTGPTDRLPAEADREDLETMQNIQRLLDPEQRELVTEIGLKTHTLFSNRNLIRLKERIDELHLEINSAKEDFKFLHRERGQLTKDRDLQKQEIEVWGTKCRELQMLKFGREIDLEELEEKSDRSKEFEAEATLSSNADKFKKKSQKLFGVSARLQEQLAEVTRHNTKLLNEVAELSEAQQKISKELNAPGQVVTHSSKTDNFREIEEQKRIAAYIKFQATELESLRTELNMLKRKEAPPMAVTMPSPPNPSGSRAPGDLILPPIPGAKKIH